MKKIFVLVLIIASSISYTSCKSENKSKKNSNTFIVNANKSEINWTAYKTTDKVPVKGKFTELTITKNGSGNTITEALNTTEFSIPVSSVFSNNPDRDNKLKTLFFGAMKNTEILSGIISINNSTNGIVSLTMNGVTENLPFTFEVIENMIQIKAIMNTDSWQAQTAIASLNKACFDLHKGADGVSKTWSDVAIDINVYFSKQ
jgi:polyisoprenoid-binding protein YceI